MYTDHDEWAQTLSWYLLLSLDAWGVSYQQLSESGSYNLFKITSMKTQQRIHSYSNCSFFRIVT